jgi:hypothetical protein
VTSKRRRTLYRPRWGSGVPCAGHDLQSPRAPCG